MDTFEVEPGDILIFYDRRFPVLEGEPRVNQVGVIVGERGALFVGKSVFGPKVERIALNKISALPNIMMRRPAHVGMNNKIADFFLANEHDPATFSAGLRALRNDVLYPFQFGNLFPPRPCYDSTEQYLEAWAHLETILRPGDAVFTVDTLHPLSRFIAWATKGPWSHVAVYLGQGEIHESVTSGIRRVPLATYRGQRYRVGAYRFFQIRDRPFDENRLRELTLNHPFKDGYNYRRAIQFGVLAFLNKHEHGLVPNSMIYGGTWDFIAQA